MTPPDPAVQSHFFIIVGALVIMGLGVIGVIRGYKWLLGEIKSLITAAFAQHEKDEDKWRIAFNEKIVAVEKSVEKVDKKVSKIEHRLYRVESQLAAMEREREFRHRIETLEQRAKALGVPLTETDFNSPIITPPPPLEDEDVT